MQERLLEGLPTVVTYFDWYLCVVPSTSAFTCIADRKHRHTLEQTVYVTAETEVTLRMTVCM